MLWLEQTVKCEMYWVQFIWSQIYSIAEYRVFFKVSKFPKEKNSLGIYPEYIFRTTEIDNFFRQFSTSVKLSSAIWRSNCKIWKTSHQLVPKPQKSKFLKNEKISPRYSPKEHVCKISAKSTIFEVSRLPQSFRTDIHNFDKYTKKNIYIQTHIVSLTLKKKKLLVYKK